MSRTTAQARPGVGREDVLDAIRAYINEHGWSPSIDDIRQITGHASRSTVKEHLAQLERQGLIERGRGPRQIRLAAPQPITTRAPQEFIDRCADVVDATLEWAGDEESAKLIIHRGDEELTLKVERSLKESRA